MLHHGTLLCETNIGKSNDRMTSIDICDNVVGIGTSSGTIAFYDVVYDTSRLKAATRHIAIPHSHARSVKNTITFLKFSPCARYLAIGMQSGIVSVFHFTTSTCHISPLHSYHEHQAPISCLAWAIDSTRVYSGCYGGRVVEFNLSRLPSDDLLYIAQSLFRRPTTLVEDCTHTIHAISTYLSHNYDYLLITAGHSVIYYQLNRTSTDSNRRNHIDKSHHARGRYATCFLTQDSSIQLFRLPPTTTKTQSVSIIICRPGTTQLFACATANGSMFHCYDLEPIHTAAVSFTHLQPIYYTTKMLGILALTSNHQLAMIHLPTCKYQVLPIYQDITAIHTSDQYIIACISDIHFMVDVFQWFSIQECRLPMRIFTANLHLAMSQLQSTYRSRQLPVPNTSKKIARWEAIYEKIQRSLSCFFATADLDLEKYNLELGGLLCDEKNYTPLMNLDEMLQAPGESVAGAPMRRQSKLISLEHEQLVSLATHVMLNDMHRREQLQTFLYTCDADFTPTQQQSEQSVNDWTKSIDSLIDVSYELLDLTADDRHARTASDCSHISTYSMDIDVLLSTVDRYTNGHDITPYVLPEIVELLPEVPSNNADDLDAEDQVNSSHDDSSDKLSLLDRCSEVFSLTEDNGIDWLHSCGDSWIDAWHDAANSDMNLLKRRLKKRFCPRHIPDIVNISPDDIDMTSPNTYVITLRVPHGIGINLSYDDGSLIVKGFSDLGDHENPAQLCGLIQPGDVLIGVNGRALDHLPIELALRLIRSFLDASSKADDPIALTFQYGDIIAKASQDRDAENPLFDLFTSITGEELVMAEHLIQNNFVSADSMMVTPATQTSHALDDDRWFSIADLVREKIRTSHIYPSSAVMNACSNTVDSRVLLSGVISDMWNCKPMRRFLLRHAHRKVVHVALHAAPSSNDAKNIVEALVAAMSQDNRSLVQKDVVTVVDVPLAIQVPHAEDRFQRLPLPFVRYLLQHTLRSPQSPAVSPSSDVDSPTLEELQLRCTTLRRQSESVTPDSSLSQRVYNFVKSAPLVTTPDIAKLLQLWLDTFRPVQPISSTNHISNKYMDKQTIIIEKLVTLHVLFIVLHPAVCRAGTILPRPQFFPPPDMLLYRDALQSYVHSFLSDFSVELRHLPAGGFTSTEQEVDALFDKYGNYINLDIFAIGVSIRQFNTVLHKSLKIAQNHTIVRSFQQKIKSENLHDHFYLLSATNKLSSHVFAYTLSQLPYLWTSKPSFATTLCISMFPFLTTWNVYEILTQCYASDIPIIGSYDHMSVQCSNDMKLNERGVRCYYQYLHQILSLQPTLRLAIPTHSMLLHFVACCFILHRIDNASTYLTDLQKLETVLREVNQRDIALLYLSYGNVSGVIDICKSYLQLMTSFDFTVDVDNLIAFRHFDRSFALQLLESSIQIHLQVNTIEDLNQENVKIIGRILTTMRLYHESAEIIIANEALITVRAADAESPSLSFHDYIFELLRNMLQSEVKASRWAEVIALGVCDALGPKVCIKMIHQWPWMQEQLKYSFFCRLAAKFEDI